MDDDRHSTELWTAPRGVRCVLATYYGRCQLRLMRDNQVIRTEVFARHLHALEAASEWRRAYTLCETGAKSPSGREP